MKFEFVPMTLEYAKAIKTWKYEGYVKDIFTDPYFESYTETGVVKGPAGCDAFAVLSDNNLAGLFEYYHNDGIIEIGLALNPKFTDKGLGKEFVEQGINFGIQEFDYQGEYIELNVNVNNKPAIRVYEKAGFVKHSQEEDMIGMRKVMDLSHNDF
ncbi:GNAT family N-acetyltransferase [Sporosalibacterium faouarense]|uniref:GNAT family N-acetyltransferase n=1 Tax=Sporosalibacterium faouarense TaxID=516123 RepID=UPI00141D13EA|nr:GNAT family N-acetyltransferase [Sporosalibacterium faouarense]MTI48665.1 GNAT family N-acetyltransferase [Bacillota bacterium]